MGLYASNHLPIHPYTYPSTGGSPYLSICPSIHTPICLSLSLSVCPFPHYDNIYNNCRKYILCFPGCTYSRRFQHVKSKRVLTQQSELLEDTTRTECAVKCDLNITCLAFNVNVNLQQCELIFSPSFTDNVTSDIQWDYYGSDLC